MGIIRALGIDTLMNDEVLSVFLWSQGMGTVGAFERQDF